METISGADTTALLESLIGRENFVILRPSLALTQYPDEEDEEDEDIPAVPDTGTPDVENPDTAASYSIYLFVAIFIGSAAILIKRKSSR